MTPQEIRDIQAVSRETRAARRSARRRAWWATTRLSLRRRRSWTPANPEADLAVRAASAPRI